MGGGVCDCRLTEPTFCRSLQQRPKLRPQSIRLGEVLGQAQAEEPSWSGLCYRGRRGGTELNGLTGSRGTPPPLLVTAPNFPLSKKKKSLLFQSLQFCSVPVPPPLGNCLQASQREQNKISQFFSLTRTLGNCSLVPYSLTGQFLGGGVNTVSTPPRNCLGPSVPTS